MSASRDPDGDAKRFGLVSPREHCTFSWQEPEDGGRRTAEVLPNHCPKCIAELKELGYRVLYVAPDRS